MSLQVRPLACTAPIWLSQLPSCSVSLYVLTSITIWKISRDFVLRKGGPCERSQGCGQEALGTQACTALLCFPNLPQVLLLYFLSCGHGGGGGALKTVPDSTERGWLGAAPADSQEVLESLSE